MSRRLGFALQRHARIRAPVFETRERKEVRLHTLTACLVYKRKKNRRKKVSLCSPLIINAWRASRTWFWVQWVRSVVHTPRIHRISPYIRTLQITSAIYHHSDINLSSSSDIWEKRKWWRWTKITPSSYMFGYTPLWNTAGYWQPRSNAAVTVASR